MASEKLDLFDALPSVPRIARGLTAAALLALAGCNRDKDLPTHPMDSDSAEPVDTAWPHSSDTGDTGDSAETGESGEVNDSNGNQDSDTQSGDSRDTGGDTAVDKEPETTSSAEDCEARLDIDLRDVATDQFIGSLGSAASLADGVFEDSNFQVTGENVAGFVSACVYDSSGNSANKTRVFRGEGDILAVEADTTATGPNVLVLRFTTAEEELIAGPDSTNTAWTYEVDEDGRITDTSYLKPDGDEDRDTFSNLEELLAHTDFTDAMDNPALSSTNGYALGESHEK
jgi:hypothetical protein